MNVIMKYSFFSIALFFLLLVSLNGVAQVNKQAKIVLKNGIKIKGGIVQSFDDSKLKVTLGDSNVFLIRFDHIKKISFQGYGEVSDNFGEKLNNPPSLKIESFYHEIKGGLLFGEDNVGVSLQTINGYQFSKYLGTGLGIGINKYGNYLTMPVYATIKGYLSDKKVSPFYFGDVGYGFAWKTNKNEDQFELNNVTGGLYWQIGLGYQINFYNSSMVFSLGYINQDSKADYIYYRPWDIDDVEISERRILRRFAFSVGFLF